MKIVAGSSHLKLAESVAEILNLTLVKRDIGHFADGEIHVEIQEDLENKPVFIIQSLAKKPNEYLIETLLLANAAKRAGASQVHGILPYLAYMRQDANLPKQAYSAQVVGQMLSQCLDSVTLVDPHTPQIAGFFSIPPFEINTHHIIANHLREKQLQNCTIVAPDIGGAKRAEATMPSDESQLAIIEKKRDGVDSVQAIQILGDVAGKDCIIIDDIVDTGHTLVEASYLLKQHKAESIRAYVTHPMMANDCFEQIQQSPIDELITFDTIYTDVSEMEQLSVKEEIASIIIQQSGG